MSAGWRWARVAVMVAVVDGSEVCHIGTGQMRLVASGETGHHTERSGAILGCDTSVASTTSTRVSDDPKAGRVAWIAEYKGPGAYRLSCWSTPSEAIDIRLSHKRRPDG